MFSSQYGIRSSPSSRAPRNLEDTLVFSRNSELLRGWYRRQLRDGSTSIKMIQLRMEYALPFHQFVVVQTRGEFGRAYRMDRGREAQGSVFDTITMLGVPPRDTIALLQGPVGELDRTSKCTKELRCGDQNTIDLLLVLSIGFRIHNNWAIRYNLLTHNCYFFARTIINTCNDRIGRESSKSNHALKRILGKLCRLLPVLLWALLLVMVLVFAHRLAQVTDLPTQLGIGIVLGVVNVLLMPLAMMQVSVALEVRAVVAWVVQLERELGQGELLEPRRIRPPWMPGIIVARMIPRLVMAAMMLLEVGLGVFLLLWPTSTHFSIGFITPRLVTGYPVFLYTVWRSHLRKRVARAGSSRLWGICAENDGAAALAAAEPDQDLGVELAATGRPEPQADVGATVTTNQAEAGLATGPAVAMQDSDNCSGAVGAGPELEQD